MYYQPLLVTHLTVNQDTYMVV